MKTPRILSKWWRGIREEGVRRKIRRAVPAPRGAPRVFYGREVPSRTQRAFGGIVKYQHLQDLFPNSPERFNILYLLSSGAPLDAVVMAEEAVRRGAGLVWNQDGVAYPAWHGPGWEETNLPMKQILHLADHVFYQSEYCRSSADRFLGARKGPAEVLYNAVDVEMFQPRRQPLPAAPLKLLMAGSHWESYRVRTALETLTEIRKTRPDTRLLLAGRFCWRPDRGPADEDVREMCRRLGAGDNVDLKGTYTHAEAPSLMGEAHILLHTKCSDPCPGVVLEALACGLPVVYSESGGTPELVGPKAGIGVASAIDWDAYTPPAPEALAEAVLEVSESLAARSASARARAVEMFSMLKWRERHREVFEELAGGAPPGRRERS